MRVYFLYSCKLINLFMYFDVLKMLYLLLIWCQNSPSGARQTFWNWLFFHLDTSPIACLAYSLSSMTNIPRSCFFVFFFPFQIFSGFFWCKMFFRHQHLNCGVHFTRASQVGARGKEPARQCRRLKRSAFDHRIGKSPWRRAWQPTLVFLSGEFHGQKSLVGYSPWGHKESDITEWLILSLLFQGENTYFQ